jgi:type III secretory pathway component EscV
VRILDNVQLEANSYTIKIKEVESGNGKVWHGQFMVMDPTGKQVTCRACTRPSRHSACPPPGSKPRSRRRRGERLHRRRRGDRARHPPDGADQGNMSELLSYGEVQKLLKELPKEQGELIKDTVPSQITVSGIQRVLQILLAERVSIRDLATILEGIADGLASTRNPTMLAEQCADGFRASFAPSTRAWPVICRSSRSLPDGSRLSPKRSSVRATIATSPCSRRSSPNSSIWCARNSSRRRAKARRRCW